MFTIGSDELKRYPELGETVNCPHCGGTHPVRFAREEIDPGIWKETETLAFYNCGERSFLCGLKGKDITLQPSNVTTWFGKGCKFQCCQWEGNERSDGPSYADMEPVLIFCAHPENPESYEGNCHAVTCPIKDPGEDSMDESLGDCGDK
jgi:hypothetical protein